MEDPLQQDQNRQNKFSAKLALRTSASYMVVAGLWIVFSDRILDPATFIDETYIQWQTVKGLLFVLVTGTLLFFSLRAQFQRLQQAETELRQANYGLTLTYDTTLEGWSRALDLRDKETEGHTRRVMELTIKLARRLNIKDEDLVHLRRGALLHDIGKLGVPDHILLKAGPLEKDEWEIMRQHPMHAYHLLYPISYLRSALAIPYSHHEHWDGNGYPEGLKGEEIPLAARVFAVVDVWDALISDRPYRKAWSYQKAFRYIRKKAGIQFDPAVVDAFMLLMEDEEYSKPEISK